MPFQMASLCLNKTPPININVEAPRNDARRPHILLGVSGSVAAIKFEKLRIGLQALGEV